MNCIQKFIYTLIFVGLPLLLNNYIFQNSLLNGERREIEAIRSLVEFSTLLPGENEELSSGALIRDGENEDDESESESEDDGNENDEELKKVLTEIASRANELLSKGDENVKSRLTDLLNEEISKMLAESENFIKEEKKKIAIKKENILNGDMHRTRMLMKKLAKKRIIIWEGYDELVMIDDLDEIIDNMLIDNEAKERVKQLARDFINTKSPFEHVKIYKEIKKYTKSEISRNKKPLHIHNIITYIKGTKLGKVLSDPFVILELAKHISLDTFLHYCLHTVEKVSEFIIPSITMSIILLYYIFTNRGYLKSLITRTKKYKKNEDESNQDDTNENIIEADEDQITAEENITAAKKEHTVNVKKKNAKKKKHDIDKKKIKYIMRVTIYLSKDDE